MPLRLLLLVCALAPALALADDPAPAAPPADVAAPAPVAASEPAAEPAQAPATPAPDPAAEPAAAPLPAPPPPAPTPEAPYPAFGVALGAGFPQGAELDLMYRPLPWLRLSAGPSWGYAVWGLHGGLVISPIRWAVSPTLGLEAGRFREMDANRFAKSADVELQPLLRRVGVEYYAATLGLELGSQRGFAFSLRLGMAWLRIDSHGTGQLTGSGGAAGQNDAVITVSDPIVRASTPTVQLAFQYFL
jgi:hypothetical protein